jgi:hypothetical protein
MREDFHKHLEFAENVISRMASNSFLLNEDLTQPMRRYFGKKSYGSEMPGLPELAILKLKTLTRR